MSGSTLAASIAEMMSLRTEERQEALAALAQYKPHPAQRSAERSPAFVDMTMYPPGLHEMGADAKSFRRRGSAASTMAGGSSIDSADSVDWSDADLTSPKALDCAGGISREVAESILSEALKQPSEGTHSTLKIANIPRRCGKEELLAAVEAVGFGTAYDFFYMPLGPQSKKNHGYAFINFKSSDLAERFTAVFVGYPIRAKFVDVTPAPLQGLAQNVEHLNKTKVTEGSWLPNVVLKV